MSEDHPEAALRRRQAIQELEQSRLIAPNNRRIGIVLSRLFRHQRDLPGAIKVLSEVLEVRRRQAITPNKDDADLCFNRACYRNLLAENIADEEGKKQMRDLAWDDLIRSIVISPENRKDARDDVDLKELWQRLDSLDNLS